MGLPPIVLVHGLASSADHGWRANGWVDLLNDDGRQVRALDLPGHGSAARSTDPADYGDVAAEIAAALSYEGEVDAVGFSVGARLLVECAARGLIRLRRLVLLGVGPRLLLPPDGTEAALADRIESGGLSPDVRPFHSLARSAANEPAVVAAFLRRRVRPLGPSDVALITCPVMVITGDRDPAGRPEDLATAFPAGTARSVRGLDHFSTPADVRVIEAVLEFLAA